ncbi:MAG: alpha/beta fold hydrolase [Thermoanaerobaculia bacterium]
MWLRGVSLRGPRVRRILLPNGLTVACWDVGPFSAPAQAVHRRAADEPRANDGPPAPPLVLLHGVGGDRREWLFSLFLLARQRRVLAFDLLAHGLSDTPDRMGVDYRISLLTNVLVSAIPSVPNVPEVIDLLGHSLGGAVALDAALRFPRLIRRLVLVDSAGLLANDALSPFSVSLDFAPRNYLEARRLLKSSVHSRLLGNDLVAWVTAISKRARRNHPELVKILASVAAGQDAVSYARLRTIPQESLVLWGAEDRIFPLATGRRLADAIPRARLEIVPDSGHVLPVERPFAFARSVTAFLDA